MLERIVSWSIDRRSLVWVLLVAMLAWGGWLVATLPIDAMPDVSTVQVSVLTTAPGLAPVEVERTVTVPIENAMNGVPGSAELRSVSRAGLSAVTVIFRDGTNPWFARQLVLERVGAVEAELPDTANKPELGPVSSGLGEIYQFVVRSDRHSPMQLRTLLDWDITPQLRTVPGIIEVNTMGGELKQLQVEVDPQRLKARGLSLQDVVDALRAANLSVGGGYLDRGAESFTVRGDGLIRDERDLAEVVVRRSAAGKPTLVRHVAEVKTAPALRQGVITEAGKGEAVSGIAMMLLGANSRDVVLALKAKVEEVRKNLPPGVELVTVYDRSDFVGRTLQTVGTNLAEGVLVVTLVLALFLGTLRGALAVALGIPIAMVVALAGMRAFGVTGDLMSLGAIDFGFLVDGPIVVLEAVVAGTAGRSLRNRAETYADLTRRVVRPVAFSVAIILLVYVPLLSLAGIEGKMFRPMALTMAFALLGALLYAVALFPGVLTTLMPPPKGHGPRWMDWVVAEYTRMTAGIVRQRWPILAAATLATLAVGWQFAQGGAEFVPRIFEGDIVVTIKRAPSIALNEGRRLDLAAEKVLHGFPEVVSTLGMTGRAEVAIDPVGNDNTDILVRLRPTETWSTAPDFDALSEIIKTRIESEVPGTFVSVSQPIEDRTNEMISGSRADVAIEIYGTELHGLATLADQIGKRVKQIRGSGDVRVERVLGQPEITAKVDRGRMAQFGVRVRDAFDVLQASRQGIRVGSVYEQQRRFDVVVTMPPTQTTVAAVSELPVMTEQGQSVRLAEVLQLAEGDGPTGIRHLGRQRAVRIDVNLRGRDLVSWVAEAQAVVQEEFQLPSGYRVAWGGQFENFERAKERLAVVVPAAVAIIFAMLFWMFGNLRLALAVFAVVPLSLTGGMLGLMTRGMTFSLSAAVGFIALGGVAVLSGVVLASEVRRRMDEGQRLEQAIRDGAANVTRAVLTTAGVAALGFLPMAQSTGAGSEVQRPLATVVVAGIAVATLVALFVLPGILRLLLRDEAEPQRE
ncbi:MAG: efflux RND transporter permease subunit [Deltaproteobacteria bacterium]|nr:efflux RND transporter permease subunit [Deltaproteobacteria bacterium]